MKELTLALSELAGRVDVSVSSADDPKTISDKISQAFESTKPIVLSEHFSNIVRSSRETKIEILQERGLTPAICNKMKMKFCSDELSLSENDDAFEFSQELARDILDMKILSLTESTAAQIKRQQDAEPPKWADITKNMQPV